MNDPLTVALDQLEATLAAVWDQADADYVARRYPWHEPTDGCDDLYGDHHHGRDRIWFYPEPVSVHRPTEDRA